MKVLILGDGVDHAIIHRLKSEGVDAIEVVALNGYEWEEVNKYSEHFHDATVLCTSSRYGGCCKSLRERGVVVYGYGLPHFLNIDTLHDLGRLVRGQNNIPTPGSEFVSCGWFDGTTWTATFVGKLYPRLLDRNHGPITSTMGCVLWQGLGPAQDLTDVLRAHKYLGYIACYGDWEDPNSYSVNNISYVPEVAVLACMVELQGTLSSLVALETTPTTDHACAVRVEDFEVQTFPEAALPHVWSQDPYVSYVSARGVDIREAARRAYRTIDRNCTLDTLYRTDIGA